jgi:uncharacterized protein (DUF952 family)
MAEPIYKIASAQDWAQARTLGYLDGTPVDLVYRGQSGLVLATIDPDLLDEGLRWEPSRGGQLFPHLYARLPMSSVIAERALDALPDGSFELPEIG